MPFTADELLESVKNGITVPNYQARLTDENMLSFADEEISMVFVPLINGIRQEYFVKIIETDVVAGQKYYDIPYRAVGRTLRDIKYINNNVKYGLRIIAEEDEQYYSNVNATGYPFGFFMQEDKIVILPTPNNTVGSLEIKYELKPNQLTLLANTGTITAIDRNTGDVTISAAVSDFTTSTPLDFIQARAGNVTLAYDITPTNVAGTILTFAVDDIPDDMVVGDYIALAGYTPVIQLPEEAHPIVANAVQCRILRALGDYEGFQVENAELDKKKAFLMTLLAPRVQGKPPVVINRNGLLRRRVGLGTRRFV